MKAWSQNKYRLEEHSDRKPHFIVIQWAVLQATNIQDLYDVPHSICSHMTGSFLLSACPGIISTLPELVL